MAENQSAFEDVIGKIFQTDEEHRLEAVETVLKTAWAEMVEIQERKMHLHQFITSLTKQRERCREEVRMAKALAVADERRKE